MKSNQLFVCFIGMDGCGKTTHARTLYEELKACGIECIYIHHTYNLIDHVPSIIKTLLETIDRKLFHFQTVPSAGPKKEKTSRSKIHIVVLSLLSFIHGLVGDIVELKSYIGYPLVIHDRYLYDHLIPYLDSCPEWLIRCYLRLIPKPDLVFLLDVYPSLAHKRRKEASIDFYTKYRQLYLSLTKKLDPKRLVIVNTNSDVNKTRSIISIHTARLLAKNKARNHVVREPQISL